MGLTNVFAIEAFLPSGSRGDEALFTVVGSAVAVALTWRRSRDYARALVAPAVLNVVSALFFLLSGQSAVSAQGLSISEMNEIVPQDPRTAFGVVAENFAQIPILWVGAFGSWGLGLLDTERSTIVWTAAGVALAILLFALSKSNRTRVWTAAVVGGLKARIPL